MLDSLLNEILLGRTNNEIYLLKSAYQAIYKKDLTQVVKGELSMKTERMVRSSDVQSRVFSRLLALLCVTSQFIMALMGNRDESYQVNHQAVTHDVQSLHSAASGMGTDEIAITSVLVTRSPAHLAAVNQAYLQQYRRPLSTMIKSEFSGHMKGQSPATFNATIQIWSRP